MKILGLADKCLKGGYILFLNPITYRAGGWSRHGILYNYSASQKRESTGSHKMSMIFTLFRMIFHVLNVSNYVEKTE